MYSFALSFRRALCARPMLELNGRAVCATSQEQRERLAVKLGGIRPEETSDVAAATRALHRRAILHRCMSGGHSASRRVVSSQRRDAHTPGTGCSVGGPCTILFCTVQRAVRCSALQDARFASRQARKTPASCRARACRLPASCAAPRRASSTDAVARSDAVTTDRAHMEAMHIDESDDAIGAPFNGSVLHPSNPTPMPTRSGRCSAHHHHPSPLACCSP